MTVYNKSATAVTQTALEQLQPVIEKNVIVDQPLLGEFEKTNVTQSGRFFDNKYIIPSTTAYPANARGVSEGTAMPTAGVSTVVRMTAALTKHVAKSEITWEQKTLGGDTKAFKEDLKMKVKNDLVRGFRDLVNCNMYGYVSALGTDQSTGVFAVVTAYDTTGAGTITVHRHDASGHMKHAPGTKWLRVGQPIMICEDDNSASDPEYTTISTIINATTFNVASGTGMTLETTDIVIPGDSNGTSRGTVLTGLYFHVNGAGPTTYQGITRATYPQLYANELNNSGTSRALTEALIYEAYDAPLDYSYTDFNVDCIVCDPKLMRTYTDLFDTYTRYRPGEGGKGLNHRKTTLGPFDEKVIRDPYCNPGLIYFIDKSSFKLIYADEMFGFENEGGDILRLRGSNDALDIYEIRSRLYCQLICDTPRKNTVLKDLIDAA